MELFFPDYVLLLIIIYQLPGMEVWDAKRKRLYINLNHIHIKLLILRSTINRYRQMAEEFDNFVLSAWGKG
jgi:hypothetical protein